MALYELTFDLSGSYSGDIPKLSAMYGGSKIGMAYGYAGSSTISFFIDTDKPFYSTNLRFYFVKGSGSDGDTISVSNLRINGDIVDTSNFGGGKNASASSDALVLDKGGYADYDASSEIPDTQVENPPPPVAAAATITGTNGDDTLYGSNAGDVISALDGNDKVIGRGGNDTVYGGAGNDRINGQAGNDVLEGQDGEDWIVGGAGNDIIRGGNDDDRLHGQDDDDTLYGEEGNDRMNGGEGDDDLYGGNGDDFIGGDAGNDYIEGNAGADQLFGNEGDDEIHGGTEDDRILGGTGNDTLYGDDGNDNMDGQEGNDTIYGGNGNDNIDGEEGNDTLDGGAGNDYITGGEGADTLNGGAGDDIMHGGGISSYDQYVIRTDSPWGTSEVWFSEQTQSFYMFVDGPVSWTAANNAAANTFLNGAAGHLVTVTSQAENDIIYKMSKAKGVSNSSGSNGDRIWLGATDVVTDQEWRWVGGAEDGLKFSQGSSPINGFYENWGSGQPNNSGGAQQYATIWFNGGASDDVWDDRNASDGHNYIIEWDAEDVLPDYSVNIMNGGAGNDLMYGGSGNDTIDGGDDSDQIFGRDGNDTLIGGNGDDLIVGGNGNDQIGGGGNNDTLFGGNGNDTINGGAGSDTIYGGNGNDILDGQSGGDVIYGDAGNDVISGGNGNDVLYGGTGDDTLSGDTGNDYIDGGAGTNTAVLTGAFANYTITLNAGVYTLVDNRGGSNDGTDTVTNVQNFQFSDGVRTAAELIGPAQSQIDGTSGNDVLYSDSVAAGYNEHINEVLNNHSRPIAGGNGTQNLLYNTETGNFYQFVNDYQSIGNVQNAINNAQIDGVTGHLVTFDDAAEISFVLNNLGAVYGSNAPSYPGSALVGDVNTGDSQQTVLTNGGQLQASGGQYIPYIVEWEGDDILGSNNNGGAGKTAILNGGAGQDDLYGGSGKDIFLFENASAFNNTDRIFNFDKDHGDSLDLSDILSDQGINVNAGNVGQYVQVDQYNGVRVDVTGNGQFWSAGNPIASFQGSVDLENASTMLAKGTLIV